MEIRLYLETTTPRNLGALIACMIANRTLSAEQLAEVVMPYLPNFAAETVTTVVKHEAVPRIPADMPTPEITALLADLNAELYSRRVIKPEDNPAAGVAATDLPMLMTQHGQIVTGEAARAMDETLDFASIFGKAAEPSEVVTLKVDNQTAETIKANPEGAAQALTATATQLDKNGLPWDSRIHAASKAINADGTWRQKRGVAPELVATVEAQLRGVMAVPVPDTPPAAQDEYLAGITARGKTHGSPELDEDAAKLEAMGGDAGPTLGDVGEFATGGTIAPLPPQSVGALEANLRVNRMPPPPPAATVPNISATVRGIPAPPGVNVIMPPTPPGNDPTTFPELVAYITAQKVAGKLAQTQLDAALVAIGVQGALPVMAARPDLIPALVAKLRVAAGG